ncbi:hypothetical protein CROQUDRAFT_97015 [Cronartium quercuum f. sp. fusiforme G11]|uniref:Uncharacterized protein n=1 Tax=Cronartium quercuum f. sp. fusiforme G11 TaxID=708437 RepID=A0A9P6T895_9BASI|nr:hypothetical protein CROQUDRAFT_97015 [Cronartium quercuum f. sp. fusiforme G11]
METWTPPGYELWRPNKWSAFGFCQAGEEHLHDVGLHQWCQLTNPFPAQAHNHHYHVEERSEAKAEADDL